VYSLNSSSQYALATSVLRAKNGGLTVDVEMSNTKWLDRMRYDKRWLVDSKTAIDEKLKINGRRYLVSARLVTALMYHRLNHIGLL
jgi:hypothetical protein